MLIVYSLMYNMPGNYLETKARELASRPGAGKSYTEWLNDLNAQYGMDKGILRGYFVWLKTAITGNWGDSWTWTIPVTEQFHNTVWYSFILSLISLVVEIVVAIPLGIMAAKKQYSFADYFTTVFAMISISLPTFFLATLLKYIFSIKLGWLDLSGMQGRDYADLSQWGKFLDVAKHFILPGLTISIISIGGLMRYTRTNMLEVLNSDYIRTARAKGVAPLRIIFGHALKNALIPVITYIGPMLAYIVTGSLVVEQIFAVPGIGRAFVQSIINRDYPLIMGTTIVLASLIVIMNLISDILYKIVDPRIDFS